MIRAAIATVAAAAAVVAPVTTASAQTHAPATFLQSATCVADIATEGHFDFGPTMDGDRLVPRVKDDRTSPAEWIDPGTIVFHLTDTARVTPPGGEFAFLGDDDVWQIPLTQQPGIPWLGWNTQHTSLAGQVDGNVTLTLNSLDGPGDLAVYSLNSFGGLGDRYFGTMDGFGSSTAIAVGATGVHVHAVWAFDAPGTYRANVTYSANVDGQPRSGTSVLSFHVGDTAPPTSCTGTGGSGGGDGPDGSGSSGSSDSDGASSGSDRGSNASGEQLAQTGLDDPAAEDALGMAIVLLSVGVAFTIAAALHPATAASVRRLGRRPRTATHTPERNA